MNFTVLLIGAVVLILTPLVTQGSFRLYMAARGNSFIHSQGLSEDEIQRKVRRARRGVTWFTIAACVFVIALYLALAT